MNSDQTPRSDEPTATIVKALDEEDTAIDWNKLSSEEQTEILDVLLSDQNLAELIHLRDELRRVFDEMDAPSYIENQMYFGSQMMEELICSYIMARIERDDEFDSAR